MDESLQRPVSETYRKVKASYEPTTVKETRLRFLPYLLGGAVIVLIGATLLARRPS